MSLAENDTPSTSEPASAPQALVAIHSESDRVATPIVEVYPCAHVMGSLIYVRRGEREELVGRVDYHSEPVGWFWCTYRGNSYRVPPRSTHGSAVDYPNHRACAAAAVEFITGFLRFRRSAVVSATARKAESDDAAIAVKVAS